MDKNEICIIIPIYKETLDVFEIQSIKQCIKVLSDYPIHFVCPRGLNINFYKEEFSEIVNFTYFDKHYFEDLAGYNRLMLSVGFYETFNNYKFMLIYQTDCYVFRDELLEWANKGFDYIGGIWFERFVGDPFLGSKLWCAGNGGFSLRKIESIIRLLTSNKPLRSINQLLMDKKKVYKTEKTNFLKELFLFPLNIFGYRNNYKYQAKIYRSNEDVYFTEAYLKYNGLKIPNVEDAISFSWDRCPEFMFEYLGHLPFACHAWYREDFPYNGNKEFWSKYINK